MDLRTYAYVVARAVDTIYREIASESTRRK